MVDALLRQLKENNEKIEEMKTTIGKLLQENAEIISKLENETREKKSIYRLWKEKKSPLLFIKKPNWPEGTCFVVKRHENVTAFGTVYSCDKNENVVVMQEDKSCNSLNTKYVLLSPSESYIKDAVLAYEANNEIENELDMSNELPQSIDQVQPPNIPNYRDRGYISTGSLVTLECVNNGEILQYQIITGKEGQYKRIKGYKAVNDLSSLGILLRYKREGDIFHHKTYDYRIVFVLNPIEQSMAVNSTI